MNLATLPAGLVRPRFVDETCDDPLPLDERFCELVLEGAPRQLLVSGVRGSGLTTALAWLEVVARERARVLGPGDVLGDAGARRALERGDAVLFADLSVTAVPERAGLPLVQALLRNVALRGVVARGRVVAVGGALHGLARWASRHPDARVEKVALAPWGADELVELLGSHPAWRERRARAFDELRRLGAGTFLLRPRAARWMLDAFLDLAPDERVNLSKLYANHLDRLPAEALAQVVAHRELTGPGVERLLGTMSSAAVPELLSVFDVPPRLVLAIARRRPTRAFVAPLALDGLHDFLGAGETLRDVASGRMPRRLERGQLPFVTEMITGSTREVLRGWLASPELPRAEATAATILHACGEPLGLGSRESRQLRGAILDGLQAPGTSLRRADLQEVSLARARLEGADLAHVHAVKLRAPAASFDGANLEHAALSGAALVNASFRRARAPRALFIGANLRGAQLEGAVLEEASFQDANLEGADLSGARLFLGHLVAANVQGACFAGACLEFALLRRLDLTAATLSGVTLAHARVAECALVGLDLAGVAGRESSFEGCDLSDLDLRGASLVGAGFERCWAHGASFDGADLRGARFLNVTFHAGSSRAGLLLGKPALEGNKTGFYAEGTTDDEWVPPESIRQASFRGADLRDAVFEGTDLFRVDLRDAVMHPSLRELAIRHGALV